MLCAKWLRVPIAAGLNAIFEPERSFSLQEDISRNEKKSNNIPIPESFQVFATVNSQPGQPLKISPATRSRFTEVQCPAYEREELKMVVKLVLEGHGLRGDDLLEHTAELLLRLYDKISTQTSILPLLKVCAFVSSQLAASGEKHIPAIEREVLKGARFLLLDALTETEMRRSGKNGLVDDKQSFDLEIDKQSFETIFYDPPRRQKTSDHPPLELRGIEGSRQLVSTFGDIR